MPGVTTCLHTVVVQRHMGHMTCVEEILIESTSWAKIILASEIIILKFSHGNNINIFIWSWRHSHIYKKLLLALIVVYNWSGCILSVQSLMLYCRLYQVAIKGAWSAVVNATFWSWATVEEDKPHILKACSHSSQGSTLALK